MKAPMDPARQAAAAAAAQWTPTSVRQTSTDIRWMPTEVVPSPNEIGRTRTGVVQGLTDDRWTPIDVRSGLAGV